MVSDRRPAHPHHLELADVVADDVRRHLDRLGRMRALTVVRLGASGAYRIAVVPAAEVRPDTLDAMGIPLMEALGLMDDVFSYEPDQEAAVLIAETNPIDGALLTFLVQGLAASNGHGPSAAGV